MGDPDSQSAPVLGGCQHMVVENQWGFAPIRPGAVRPGNNDAAGVLARNREALAMEDGGTVHGSENRGGLRPIDIFGSAVERAHLETSSGGRCRILYCPLVL